MKDEGPKNDAILFIQIASIANTSDLLLGSSKLSLYLLRSKQVGNNRIAIATKECSLQEGRCSIGEVGLALCQREDYFEIEFSGDGGKVNAYLKLPLEKLLDLPRVKHEIECQLVEKNWDRFFEGPLRNIVQVDLSIISFPQIKGRLAIRSVEVEIAEGSASLLLSLQGETQRAEGGSEQKAWVWKEGGQFEVDDLNKSLTLAVSAFDGQQGEVGRQEIDLLAQHMLLPQQQPSVKSFPLLSGSGKGVGSVTVQYQFILSPN